MRAWIAVTALAATIAGFVCVGVVWADPPSTAPAPAKKPTSIFDFGLEPLPETPDAGKSEAPEKPAPNPPAPPPKSGSVQPQPAPQPNPAQPAPPAQPGGQAVPADLLSALHVDADGVVTADRPVTLGLQGTIGQHFVADGDFFLAPEPTPFSNGQCYFHLRQVDGKHCIDLSINGMRVKRILFGGEKVSKYSSPMQFDPFDRTKWHHFRIEAGPSIVSVRFDDQARSVAGATETGGQNHIVFGPGAKLKNLRIQILGQGVAANSQAGAAPPVNAAQPGPTASPASPAPTVPPATAPAPQAAPAPPSHLPAPPAAVLAKSAQLMHEIYAADYRDSSALGRRKLAKKMIVDSASMQNDPAGKFTLLSEARDQALVAGDAPTAFLAIDTLGASFAIDGNAMTAEVLIAIKPKPGVDDGAVIVQYALRALAPLVQGGQIELAAKLIPVIHSAAAKVHDPSLAASANAAIAWGQFVISESEKVRPSIEKLKTDPADAAANAAVGKFFCFCKGDWNSGLAALAKGNDPRLAALAKKDLANPGASGDCRAVADGWWDVGETLPQPIKPAAHFRAAIWYQRALAGGLNGLAKALAERRIAEAGPTSGQGSAPVMTAKSGLEALGDGQFTKPWPAASTTTYFKGVSTPGESIGGGKTFDYTGAALRVEADSASLRVMVDGWDMHFSAPHGRFLTVGEYPDAQRWPFNKESPGLSFSGHGHGANKVEGKFVIWELVVQHGKIVRLAVDFIHRSAAKDAPIYGMVRYNSTLE